MLHALLVYPALPPSYWSETYALKFIGRKAAMPPLGLLTLAALFPARYTLRLIDMNTTPLTDSDLAWADYVFCSAMIAQRDSFRDLTARCNRMQKPLVAGGPYPTSFHEVLSEVDYIVPGEVEEFFVDFLDDLEAGKASHIYRPADCETELPRPAMQSSPLPRYDLVQLDDYASVSIQFSRGCPYNCEFCDITKLYGRTPRTKTNAQILSELQVLYNCGWRSPVFFVDDNFIGNCGRAKELLPEIARWQSEHAYPFSFFTEASVNLADMPGLLDQMVEAGFDMVFLGLETPNAVALAGANKGHNLRAGESDYLLKAVHKIQAHGLEVLGGFILGLDGDDELAFDAQIEFIQKAGIATAMVGLLTAVKGTQLYERYQAEGRLLSESSGNNVSLSLNFIPGINRELLLAGYKRVLSTIYDSSMQNYFARCYTLLSNWRHRGLSRRPFGKIEVRAVLRSFRKQLLSRQGPAYLKFLLKIILFRRAMFAEAIRLAILGYHYEKVTRQQLVVDEFRTFLESECRLLEETASQLAGAGRKQLAEARRCLQKRLKLVSRRYSRINLDFRCLVDEAFALFRARIGSLGPNS